MELQDLNKIKLGLSEKRYLYNGISVPRVTNILSKTIHEDYLMQWSNSLGFKRKGYSATLKSSADYGTKTHNAVENYLKGLPITEDTPINPINGFINWWNIINLNNKVTILGQECKLVCPWFGGTYDMLIEINGAIYLVDFKTSNHLSYKYCLQLAAYNYMLKLNGITNLAGIIILQLKKDVPDFNEFVLNFDNPNHTSFFNFCENTFLSLVYSYYHILEAERLYKKLAEDE
jgi:hypothetical protein